MGPKWYAHLKHQARTNIEGYCENMEKTLLDEFNKAYSRSDRETMSHIAKTLLDFNGGSSCVQIYVAQHAFFINSLKVGQNEMDIHDGSRYRTIDNSDLNNRVQQELSRLYDEIRQTFTNEWDIIYQVFPNALSVMMNFVQRIFAQPVKTAII